MNRYRCETDARCELVRLIRRLSGGGAANAAAAMNGLLSLRWRRSGAEGLLVAAVPRFGDAIEPDDVHWLRMDGETAGEGGGSQAATWRLHRDLLAHRADAAAVAQLSPVFATTLACSARVQREGIPALHRLVAATAADQFDRDENTIRCSRHAAPGSDALSNHVIAAIADRRACLVAGRGLVSIGTDVADAVAMALTIEALAQRYWQLLQLGDPAFQCVGTEANRPCR